MKKNKKRGLNYYRQTKDSFYKHPKKRKKQKFEIPKCDPQTGEPNPYYKELTGEDNPYQLKIPFECNVDFVNEVEEFNATFFSTFLISKFDE